MPQQRDDMKIIEEAITLMCEGQTSACAISEAMINAGFTELKGEDLEYGLMLQAGAQWMIGRMCL